MPWLKEEFEPMTTDLIDMRANHKTSEDARVDQDKSKLKYQQEISQN